MEAAFTAGIGFCYYIWASDWFKKPSSFMSGMFVGVMVALVLLLAVGR
jgi:threonine/homoserine efflux transporter RhtA